MRLMIGQLPQPTGLQLLIWLACAGAVLGGLAFTVVLFNGLAKARQTISGKRDAMDLHPQPLEVRPAHAFVTEPVFQSATGTLQRQIDALSAERKQDVSELHEKVNGVAREVSGLTTGMELQNQRLASIDGKLDRMIERAAKKGTAI